jgi:hypothetical protein
MSSDKPEYPIGLLVNPGLHSDVSADQQYECNNFTEV